MKTIKLTIIIFLTTIFCILTALAQNNYIRWSSFNQGFAETKTSNTILKSIAGQSFVGSSLFGNSFIESGFLVDTLFRSVIVNVKEQTELPSVYELYQNYPNPFNPSTTIRFDIPKESHVTLKVYNILGQEVATLVDEVKKLGSYEVKWNPSASSGQVLASGVYFYCLQAIPINGRQAGTYSSTRKLVIIQ